MVRGYANVKGGYKLVIKIKMDEWSDHFTSTTSLIYSMLQNRTINSYTFVSSKLEKIWNEKISEKFWH